MKEPYIPPMIEVICFAPLENLALEHFFDVIDLSETYASSGESWKDGDAFIPIG